MFTNEKRAVINTFVCAVSLYVAETPKTSIKDQKPVFPIIPFGIVAYGFVGQPFSKQLYIGESLSYLDNLLVTQIKLIGVTIDNLPSFQYYLLKTPLITALGAYNSKTARWIFQFILSTFDKHDKTQLLAEFKKILYMGFRATLNFFPKFKVALNPMYRIFLNFAKSCVLSCLSNVDNIKKIHRAVFEL